MPETGKRKAGFRFGEREPARAAPAALRSRASRPPREAEDVREVRLRLSVAVVEQLRDVARVERCSMNALVADYLDLGFRREGHKGIDELAPGFAGYLRGDRKNHRQAVDPATQQSDVHAEPEETSILPLKFMRGFRLDLALHTWLGERRNESPNRTRLMYVIQFFKIELGQLAFDPKSPMQA